jgi:hypothetical protein
MPKRNLTPDNCATVSIGAIFACRRLQSLHNQSVATLARGAWPQGIAPRARDWDTPWLVSLRTIVACELAVRQSPLYAEVLSSERIDDIGT